jgi:hypothetical protein
MTIINKQETISIQDQLTIQVGTFGAPGLAFASDLDTGISQAGPGQVGLVADGALIVTAAPLFVSSNRPFAAPQAAAGTGFVFKDGLARNTGMFSDTIGEIGWASFGSEVMRITNNGALSIAGPNAQYILPSHSAASLPLGTQGGMIFVPDETGGPVPAYYDGTNWRRVTDGAIVS